MKTVVVVGLMVVVGLSMSPALAIHGKAGDSGHHTANPNLEPYEPLEELRANFQSISPGTPIDIGNVRRDDRSGTLVKSKLTDKEVALAGLEAIEEFYDALRMCEMKREGSVKPQIAFMEEFIGWLKGLSDSKADPITGNQSIVNEADLKSYMYGFDQLRNERKQHYSSKGFSGWSEDHVRYESDLFSQVEGLAEAIVPGFKVGAPRTGYAPTTFFAVQEARSSVKKETEVCPVKQPAPAAPINPAQVAVNRPVPVTPAQPTSPVIEEPTPSPSPSEEPSPSPSPTESDRDDTGGGGGGDGKNGLEAQQKELQELAGKISSLGAALERVKDTPVTKPTPASPVTPPSSGLDPNLLDRLAGQGQEQQQPQQAGSAPQAGQPQQQTPQVPQPEKKEQQPDPSQMGQQGGQPPILPGTGSGGSQAAAPQPTPAIVLASPSPTPAPVNTLSKDVSEQVANASKATDYGLMSMFAGQQQQQQQAGFGQTPRNPLSQGFQTAMTRAASFGRTAINTVRSAFARGASAVGRAVTPSLLAK
jgi:hypothetical protein